MEGTQPCVLALVTGGYEGDMQVTTIYIQIDLPGLGEVMLLFECADQLAGGLQLLRPLVFQQQFMIATAHHAKAGRCGVDDCAAEGLAFGDARMGLMRGEHYPGLVPAVEGPATTGLPAPRPLGKVKARRCNPGSS